MILYIMNRFFFNNEHIIYLCENEITFDELFNDKFIEIPKNIKSIKMNEIYNNNLEFLLKQTNLTSLILSHKFNKTIENITHCTNLTKLHFGYFFDNDISSITCLKNLETLQLSERFTGCPKIISNLTHLKKLNLGRDMFEDNKEHNIDFLLHLTNLIKLDLGFRFNGYLDNLGNLTKLTKLVLGHKFNKPLDILMSLPKLNSFSSNKTFLGDYTSFRLDNIINKKRNNNFNLILSCNYNQPLNFILKFMTIRKLELGLNFYQDISCLTSLSNLSFIIFNNNYIQSINCLNILTKLSSIQFKNNYTYPIKNFKYLTYLSILNINGYNSKQLDLLSNINLKCLELNFNYNFLKTNVNYIELNKLPINLVELKLTGLLTSKLDIELIPITLKKLVLPVIYNEDIVVPDYKNYD